MSGRRIVVTYTVQPGETLSQIARQFEVRPDVIAQSTGLDDPNRIVVGSVLFALLLADVPWPKG